MAHKYKQDRKDRRDESMGMKRKDKYAMEDYHHIEERSDLHIGSVKTEGMDSRYMGMLHEDHYSTANLPQEVVNKKYPPYEYTNKYELDDTIKGIDENYDNSIRKVEAYPSTSMY